MFSWLRLCFQMLCVVVQIFGRQNHIREAIQKTCSNHQNRVSKSERFRKFCRVMSCARRVGINKTSEKSRRHKMPTVISAAISPIIRLSEPKKNKREKFMPAQKTDMELFAPEMQIQSGEHFDQLCGIFMDDDNTEIEVYVDGPNDAPTPVLCFEECRFSDAMLFNLSLSQMNKPTQIQQYVMSIILKDDESDILASAQTGSGKTAAFMLPIIHRIINLKNVSKIDASIAHINNLPYTLILAPTRELCQQLSDDARRFSKDTGVSVCVSYGEMPMHASMTAVRAGCDIFISTITRAQHFVRENIISLKNIKFWVIDEMDLLINVKDPNYNALCYIKEKSDINPNHRTFLFSATHSAENVIVLERFLRTESTFFVIVGSFNKAVSTVQQHFVQVSKYEKRERLLKILRSGATNIQIVNGEVQYTILKTIIFVATKRQSERLAHELAWNGFSVTNINGDRLLRQRYQAISEFSKGKFDILVATDVASRGMNFPHVVHIINFDLPTMEEINYIHRLGRSGRAGNVGMATSFFDATVDSKFTSFYAETLLSAKQEVPQFMKDILNNQMNIERQLYMFTNAL